MSPEARSSEVGSPEANKAVARRYIDALNGTSHAAADAVITPDYAVHIASLDYPPGITLADRCDRIHTAFEGYHATIEDLIAEGDRVTIRYTGRGKSKANGRPFTYGSIMVLRLVGDRVAEEWTVADSLSMRQQIGEESRSAFSS